MIQTAKPDAVSNIGKVALADCPQPHDVFACSCCSGDTTIVAPVCVDCVERSRWRRVEDEPPTRGDGWVQTWHPRDLPPVQYRVDSFGLFGWLINHDDPPTHWRHLPRSPKDTP